MHGKEKPSTEDFKPYSHSRPDCEFPALPPARAWRVHLGRNRLFLEEHEPLRLQPVLVPAAQLRQRPWELPLTMGAGNSANHPPRRRSPNKSVTAPGPVSAVYQVFVVMPWRFDVSAKVVDS
jgi:hypothetical protein